MNELTEFPPYRYLEAAIPITDRTCYCLRAGATGWYKIGIAHEIRFNDRIEPIQATCPEQLDVYDALMGNPQTEKFLHEYYADYRMHHEWFRDLPEQPFDIVRQIRLDRGICYLCGVTESCGSDDCRLDLRLFN